MLVLVIRLLSVLGAAVAAFMWFRSSAVPFPLLSGAAIGGTLPDDPFNVAVKHAGFWNERAAIMTGVSVLLSAVAEVVSMIGLNRKARVRV